MDGCFCKFEAREERLMIAKCEKRDDECVFVTLLCVGLGQFENKITSVGSLRQ
jgi:hypothetical protein